MKLWQKFGLPPPKSEASGGDISLKENEIYSGIEIPEMPLFVRLDGWKWHSLAKFFKKPFDKFVPKCLSEAAKEIMKKFNGNLAYIFSDEINILFLKLYGFRRIEKINSIFSGIASSICSRIIGKNVVFDCRCIPIENKEKILKYLIWRQAECFRNYSNAWAQFLLGGGKKAAEKLKGLKIKEVYLICKKLGIDLLKKPKWQRHGILLYWEKYKKRGWNPVKKENVIAIRRRIKINWEIPNFNSSDGKKFLNEIL